MAQVSRRFINPKVEKKINKLLLECISQCTDQQVAAAFVDDLLTQTEKTMIAKRIAIALMDLKGYSPQDIEDTLKVSYATIYKVKTWLEFKGAGYRALLEKIIKRDEKQEKYHREALRDAQEGKIWRPTNWKDAKRRQWQEAEETEVPF